MSEHYGAFVRKTENINIQNGFLKKFAEIY